MHGLTEWQHHPYRPYHRIQEAQSPFICRLAPGTSHIELEWFDAGSLGSHILEWRLKGSDDPWQQRTATAARLCLDNLPPDQDYELRIRRAEGSQETSATRYARTGDVPGIVVNYLHPDDEIYAFSGRALCSPSLVILPSGALLASMDLFAPGAPQNLTLLFRSDDRGQSWRYVADLFSCYWATLFVHRGRLYVQACSTEYGDILIGASDDEGQSWTAPVHLFPGSSSPLAAGWQRTPMPILRAHGRLFVSVDYGAWKEGGHQIGLLSIPDDADLLVSRNWTCSDLIAYDPAWPGAPTGKSSGLLEGSMVISPDGRLLNLLRIGLIGCQPDHGVAVLLEADADNPEAALKFHRFIAMPSGSNSKTHVLYDDQSRQYLAIGNICVDPATPGQRNVLALQSSRDLYHWQVVKVLLDYRTENPQNVGFQYISFLIDGDDLLVLSRTSLNKSRNFHDANYATFHVVANFRQYLP